MIFKRIINFLHLWLGLLSGLVVFLMALSGCAYVFVDELKPIVYHDRYFVQPEQKAKLPLSQLLAIAQNELGANIDITRIEINNAADRSVVFRSQKNNPDGLTHWDYFEYYYRVYINPYSGQVLKVEDTKNEFFQLALSLHMRMLFGEKVGHYVVGYSVLMFFIILVTGIIMWYPKNWKKKNVNESFKIKWRAKWKRLNYDLHKVLGFYAFFILLLTSVTGLVWVFDWVHESVRFVANGAQVVPTTKLPLSDSTMSYKEYSLDKAYVQVQSQYPEAYAYLIILPKKAQSTLNIFSYLTDWNRYQRVFTGFDRYSGQLLINKTFQDLNNGDKAFQLNFDLHTGAYLGLFGKILSFFAALLCSTLPVTGFYIWWNKKRKSKKVIKLLSVEN